MPKDIIGPRYWAEREMKISQGSEDFDVLVRVPIKRTRAPSAIVASRKRYANKRWAKLGAFVTEADFRQIEIGIFKNKEGQAGSAENSSATGRMTTQKPAGPQTIFELTENDWLVANLIALRNEAKQRAESLDHTLKYVMQKCAAVKAD